MNRKKIMELLSEIRDDIDFENCTALIDDGVLESFDIIQLIASLNREYDIEIPATQIIPANFNSPEAILKMVEKLSDD